jgi:mannose-6-phosphate isomerase
MKLVRHSVEKPWGRTGLPGADGRRIGEIWFEAPDGRPLPLLVKHIFTSEKLSVQVHPNDAQARARGLPNGKSECWYILDAEPSAMLGLGFKQPIGKEAMRQAALDGSIEALIDWRPVRAGDFFYVPAGTVHAIGAGLSLIEVQQQSDTTYRLYDYGRPRELHLDDGIAVATVAPFPDGLMQHLAGSEPRTLVDDRHFTLVQATGDALQERLRWVLPLAGEVRCGETAAGPGDCLLVQPGERLETSAARLLIGASARPS